MTSVNILAATVQFTIYGAILGLWR